jgi:NADPH:quinone reductase-like Zn-dependent oxidoreductase
VPGTVVFGTASASKHDFLKSQGIDHAIDYRTADYAQEVRRLTKDEGVDLVLDPLGGDDWKKGYELLRSTGMLVAYGFANMSAGEKRNLFRVATNYFKVPKFSPMSLMDQNRAVAGVNMGHLWKEVDLLSGELRALLALYREGKIKPTVDKVFKFEEAAAAHRRMHERKNVGKIILVP